MEGVIRVLGLVERILRKLMLLPARRRGLTEASIASTVPVGFSASDADLWTARGVCVRSAFMQLLLAVQISNESVCPSVDPMQI